jgi:hypothetical protein
MWGFFGGRDKCDLAPVLAKQSGAYGRPDFFEGAHT